MPNEQIRIKGARVHNLDSVDLTLPRNRLICFTGVSGSGKSSLAFDTLHAEGQRRYLESLSAYARQFLGQVAKPDVDLITGLSPTISIQQQSTGWNPRSTVGTVTQIHDYLRVLFARVGTQHCPTCNRPITAQTREQIIARILAIPTGTKIHLLAPVARNQKGEFRDLRDDMIRRGFARARVDGHLVELSDELNLDRNVRHDIEIIIDRLTVKPDVRARLADSLDTALDLGQGTVIIQFADQPPSRRKKRGESDRSGDLLLSAHYACTRCDRSFDPPTPQLFSFNSPTGMCESCDGLGTRFDFDPDLLVPDPNKSFLNLAVEPMRTRIGKWRKHIYEAVADYLGISLTTPWKKLPAKARQALLFGTGDTHLTFKWKWSGGVWQHGGTFEGVISELRDKHRKAQSAMVRRYYEKYMRKTTCPACHGNRLNPQALAVRLNNRSIADCLALPASEAAEWFANLELSPTQRIIAHDAIKEIVNRLNFLVNVGLHYLTLDRPAPTLSGGESQRIRLASQIGSGLVGVLYILDEPSIGLHPRDNQRLLNALKQLRDMGNTVIVVEHDEQTMREADLIVDFGPGPGVHGGKVVAVGDLNKVAKSRKSITARYLTGKDRIEIPNRRPVGPVPNSIAAPRKEVNYSKRKSL